MDGDRCPHCTAAVKPGAPWCTLCYADLRPAPADPLDALVHAAAGGSHGPYQLPAYAESSALAELSALTEPAAVGALPAELIDAAPVPKATWPCLRCGSEVALTEPVCTVCGGGFLQGMPEATIEAAVPGLSRLGQRYQGLSKGARLAAVVGLGFAVSVVFVVLLAVVGLLVG